MLNPDNFHFHEYNKRELHLFYRETRVFIFKEKEILGEWVWTCKSCLSYVPSHKADNFEKAEKQAKAMVSEFLKRFE